MLLDLVDHLRCPRPHPTVPGGVALVCVPTRVVGRQLDTAQLGCPICHARFEVVAGVARFGPARHPTSPNTAPHDIDEEHLLRLAALLNLDTPGGWVLLHGEWQWLARTVAERFGVSVVVLSDDDTLPDPVSVLAGVHDALPLAPALLRGAAVDAPVSDALLVSIAGTLMPNGRLVAPVGCVLPPAMAELARDHHHWVAEPRAEPIAIRRAPSTRTPGR